MRVMLNSTFAGCSSPIGNRLRDEPLRGGKKEREGRTAQDLQRKQVPEPGVTGQEQGCDRSLRGGGHRVRADHDQVARKPVGEDAAEEDQDELRDPVCSQHEAEVALRAGKVEHPEREGDRGDGRAQHRDELPAEEQAELTMGERA